MGKSAEPALGTLYGVGAGPGDPDLLTLKAVRVLQAVDVVFFPVARAGAESMARRVVARHLTRADQRVEELVFAMREGLDVRRGRWAEHAEAVADALVAGQDAAFVTEGDPMLYSTFLHMAGALRERLPEATIEVVPGVSSPSAAAAAAYVPLADGAERLAVLPGIYDLDAIRRALADFDCVVILKVAGVIDGVLDALEEQHVADGSVLVSRCGWPDEVVVRDVRSLRGRRLDYFSLLIARRMS